MPSIMTQWMMVGVLLLTTALVPIGQALAVPYSYQFTSGPLAGGFTADPMESHPFISWHFTETKGSSVVVWDLTNPLQGVFGNQHFGVLARFALFIGPSAFESTDFIHVDFEDFGGWDIPPNRTGIYSFNSLGPQEGAGTWAIVPEPSSPWLLLVGVLGLLIYRGSPPRPAGVPGAIS
jgi:hypothetical protein